jgi:hypothetical protein
MKQIIKFASLLILELIRTGQQSLTSSLIILERRNAGLEPASFNFIKQIIKFALKLI